MTIKTLVNQVNDSVGDILALVRYARQNGLKPMCCVVNPSPEKHPEFATLVVYAANMYITQPYPEKHVPLIPYFYHYAVASELVARGLIIETTTSARTGVTTHWCEFTDLAR